MERYRHGESGAVVEAIQLAEETADEIERAVPGAVPVKEIDRFTREESKAFNIPTTAGMVRLSAGQFLVKYAGGLNNFLVLPPGQFRGKYIPMEVSKGFVPKDVRDSKILRDRTEDDY